MCGIAGQINFDNHKGDDAVLRRMVDVIRHRGPDGDGYWIGEHAALGHCRLAIRDLSPTGQQPMVSDDGKLAMVFNGQIYNDAILKETLCKDFGAQFKGTCDAEIIIPAYKAWGIDFFNKIEGMFAITLWDAREHTLIFARDASGIKPLFVHEQNSTITFASEIKGILPGLNGQSPPLSLPHLTTFFTQGYIGPTDTLYRDIRQIKPGTVEWISPKGRGTHTFWNPQRQATRFDIDEAVGTFSDLFSAVCHEHLASDVPVGILQSGGIDSSLISLTLRDTPRDLFCAKIDQGDFDETGFAKKISELTRHTLHSVDGENDTQENIISDFKSVVHHFDGQVADSSALSVFRLCRAVSKHVKVALSGDGADEHFAGYKTYNASAFAAAIGGFLPKKASEHLAKTIMQFDKGDDARRYPLAQSLGRMVMAMPYGKYAHSRFRRYLMPWDAERILSNSLLEHHADTLSGYDAAIAGGGSVIDQCLLADQTYYLPADMLWKADAMSMAHGLELRVPFLDRRVMHFAASLSAPLLGERNGQPQKRVLRECLQRLGAPTEITHRPKAGFNVPISSLLREGLRPLAMQAFEKNADAFAPYLKPAGIRAMWREHAAHEHNNGYLLWTMLTFAVHNKIV